MPWSVMSPAMLISAPALLIFSTTPATSFANMYLLITPKLTNHRLNLRLNCLLQRSNETLYNLTVHMTDNKAITALQKEVSPLVKTAEKYQVHDIVEARAASEFLKKINDTLKIIEAKRLSFTAPLNQSLSEINNTFREMSAPLTEVKGQISNRILDWKRIEADRIAKEEARRRAIQEAHKEAGHNVNAPVEIARPNATIGNSQTRKVWRFRVVEQAKVPESFKVVNSVMINDQIRQGVREIPGIEIYQEDVMAIV
jgi:hypothetical protein